MMSFLSSPPFPHLHHQHNSVECNHGQDSVLKGRRHHKMPQTVLERVPILWHVSGQGLGADGKVYACPLKQTGQTGEACGTSCAQNKY